jgi:ribosomal protein L5
LKALSEITGLSSSTVSRRHDAARFKLREDKETSRLVASVRRAYRLRLSRIAESQA